MHAAAGAVAHLRHVLGGFGRKRGIGEPTPRWPRSSPSVAPRAVTQDSAVDQLQAFAAAVPAADRPATLALVFSGLVDETNAQRSQVIERLREVDRRQRDLTQTAARVTQELRALPPDAPAAQRDEVTTPPGLPDPRLPGGGTHHSLPRARFPSSWRRDWARLRRRCRRRLPTCRRGRPPARVNPGKSGVASCIGRPAFSHPSAPFREPAGLDAVAGGPLCGIPTQPAIGHAVKHDQRPRVRRGPPGLARSCSLGLQRGGIIRRGRYPATIGCRADPAAAAAAMACRAACWVGAAVRAARTIRDGGAALLQGLDVLRVNNGRAGDRLRDRAAILLRPEAGRLRHGGGDAGGQDRRPVRPCGRRRDGSRARAAPRSGGSVRPATARRIQSAPP